MLSKKAQISIEVLTILSILVIGSIMFGVYYLSNIRDTITNVPTINEKDIVFDDTTITPGGTVIEPPAEVSGNLNISVTLPATATVNGNFNVNVEIGALPTGGTFNKRVVITEINVKDASEDLLYDCNYGSLPINGILTFSDPEEIEIGDSVGADRDLSFACSSTGSHTIIIKTEIDANSYYNIADEDTITITSSTPPADVIDLQLSLVPNEPTPQGAPGHKRFGVLADVNDYAGGLVFIKKIYARDLFSDNNCYYYNSSTNTNLPIGANGLGVVKAMTALEGGDYNSLLQLSCTNLGDQEIIVTVGKFNNTASDVNATITKRINTLDPVLELVPDGSTNKNVWFGLDVDVNNYNSNSNLQIAKIYARNITDPTGRCYLGNYITIPPEGQYINHLMQKTDNDYNYSFINNLRCDKEGEHIITITLHDMAENSNYDANATIPKAINLGRCQLPTGTGTLGNPYVVKTASDLDCIRYNLSKHFILGQDIDLNHTLLSAAYWYNDVNGWDPIGMNSSPFTGSLDGNGYVISNLYINKDRNPGCNTSLPNYIEELSNRTRTGLFAKSAGADFRNITLSDINVTGSGAVGFIRTFADGTIDNVNVTGNIVGGRAGLAGQIFNTNVTNSSFEGNISGSWRVGGLIGVTEYYSSGRTNDSHSYITNSHFSGNIDGPSGLTGGLIGESFAVDIDNCYTTGKLTGTGIAGGFIGQKNAGFGIYPDPGVSTTITSSYSTMDINMIGQATGVGGFIGTGGTYIYNCYSTGDITIAINSGTAHSVGGFSGWGVHGYGNYSTGDITIKGRAEKVGGFSGGGGWAPSMDPVVGMGVGISDNSYSTGDINITGKASWVGGFLGMGQMYNDYSTGNITIGNSDANYVGGLVGLGGAVNSYSTGSINKPGSYNSTVGGLIGGYQFYELNSDTIKSYDVNKSYWDKTTSGMTYSLLGEGRTTDEMTYPYAPNTYDNWDWTVWAADEDNSANDGYPYLISTGTETKATGSGCTLNPGGLIGAKQNMTCGGTVVLELPSIPQKVSIAQNEELGLNMIGGLNPIDPSERYSYYASLYNN